MVDFWENWKDKTALEERAIISVKKGRELILNLVPAEEIKAIYVKGSFPRRELNETSDVDTVTILGTNDYRKKVESLDVEYREKVFPRIEFASFSLWELENNEHFYTDDKFRARPDRFSSRISCYELIYGEPLDTAGFKMRTPKKALKDLKTAFYEGFIPLYEQKKMGFEELIKQVFWLAELEGQVDENGLKNSWKELVESIGDKKHIVYETYNLRLNPTKDKVIKADYIKKLNNYLARLN